MRFLAVACAIAVLATAVSASEQPFNIRVEKTSSLSLEVFGQSPQTRLSPDSLEWQLNGTERSECRPYGRQSAAQGVADVDIERPSRNAVALKLRASATAHGGHYRTCGKCLMNNCVGIHGNDTRARSDSAASARIAITFDPTYRPVDYSLHVSAHSTGGTVALSLVDQSGRPVPMSEQGVVGTLIQGRPGAVYYLDAKLAASAQNEGGCCQDGRALDASVDVRLTRAPIHYSAMATGFIAGGRQTNSFKNVGALLLDGNAHCSGTVIGPRTVLTAAHCVYLQESEVTRFSFSLGSNVLQPEHGPFKVVGFDYPSGEPAGFRYNDVTLEDDIAVVYLDAPVSISFATLHAGTPPWDEIMRQQLALTFVGFGFNVIDGEMVGLGVKREASWAINGVQNRRVSFKVAGLNTCHGDSGGPALLDLAQSMVLVAITSGGDSKCTEGFDTRVDAYRAWLDPRVR